MTRQEPLIVTAHLDERSFDELDTLRRRHFPRKLNKIPAHVSLFHQLPGEDLGSVSATMTEACRTMRPFEMQPVEWRSLGRGVAIAYEAAELARLHERLSAAWQVWLTAQDRQRFRAHVTIQNKVEPAAARALLETLRDGPEPPTCNVEGLTLWRYLGGPWEHVETFRFGESTPTTEVDPPPTP